MLAFLSLATIAVVDNAFFSVISRQPQAIERFRASGMTSMRAYLNADLESIAPVVIAVAGIAGAIFAPLGRVLAGPAHARRASGRPRVSGD